ncbi:hypothetical protein [Okeania sp. SIO1I7]|nr:hypothetical protein [Okeania sp. SIO1I7]NET27294.1 hypothetical protein [Okeania sp. SIO1I7]
MSHVTAAVLRPQVKILETKISEYNKRYDQLTNILAPVENISIPSPL